VLFDGTGTQLNPAWMDTGTTGAALGALVTSLTPGTVYHWRLRLHYQATASPFQQRSRWFTVPWTGWQEADLRTAAPPSGRVPDDALWPGQPLTLEKAPDGQITLRWSGSCLGTDTDYEIYEGTVGSYYSHAALSCTTGGATSITFVPASGFRYYLVVPRNLVREGSYGLRSSGAERPQLTGACLPQQVGTCP